MAFSRIGLALVVWCATSSTAQADEGMWTINGFPRAQVKERYGVEITDKWLQHLQLSSVRFGQGGSGAFISPHGLIMTNHHVGADCIAKLGRKDHDFHRDGFYAKSEAEALRCPGLALDVLVAIDDVSGEVRGTLNADAAEPGVAAARRERIATIEKRCVEKTPGARCSVVTLYRGGAYHLYRYRRFTDVRLVFSPEFAIAFFGGDPDNFTYPRYAFDVALFRAYDGDQPVSSTHYLRWSKAGAREDELVFTAGHPGTTLRMATSSMLRLLRDDFYPLVLSDLARQHELLTRFSQSGAEAERTTRKPLFSVDNSIKAITGYAQGLKDPELFDSVSQEENKLKGRLSKQPEVIAAWDTIDRAVEVAKQISVRLFLLEGRRVLLPNNDYNPFGAHTFAFARTLVRLVDEQAKPDAERLHEYTDAERNALELKLYSPAPVPLDLDEAYLVGALQNLVTRLGAKDPITKLALAGKTPSARAKELVRGTRLADPDARRELATSRAAQDKARDPMIAFARALDAESRALRKRYQDEVEGPLEVALGRITRAHLALDGAALPPDATGTLRISFGRISPYLEGQKVIPPMTVVAGLFGRAQKHDNQPPWQVPATWVAGKAKLKPLTPMNLISDNDITGGNSGSPLVNAAGEVVGLVFDENIHALANLFMYRGERERTVSVHSVVLTEALRKIYGADRLVDEMTGLDKPTR